MGIFDEAFRDILENAADKAVQRQTSRDPLPATVGTSAPAGSLEAGTSTARELLNEASERANPYTPELRRIGRPCSDRMCGADDCPNCYPPLGCDPGFSGYEYDEREDD
jgi:hypothetical protein